MEVVFIAGIKKGKGCWEVKAEIPFASKKLKEAKEFLKDKDIALIVMVNIIKKVVIIKRLS